jgi:hypothetical protein
MGMLIIIMANLKSLFCPAICDSHQFELSTLIDLAEQSGGDCQTTPGKLGDAKMYGAEEGKAA